MSDIRKVTLYRIKDGLDFPEFLRGDLGTYDHTEDSENNFEAYIKYEQAGGRPKTEDSIPWLRFLNSGSATRRYRFESSNRFPRAVFALKIAMNDDGRFVYYAATFGVHGDTFLDKDHIVYDFGIRVAMNICDIDGLRRVQTSAHEAITRQTERQASVGANLSIFQINTDAEFLRTLSGHVKPQYRDIVESFKGKDSIAIKLPRTPTLTWAGLAAMCLTLEDRYIASDYKETEFQFYDLLRHETDPTKVDLLDQLLCKRISDKNFSKIHLASPEFVDGEDVEFCYRQQAEGDVPTLYDDLAIEDLVSQPRRRLQGLNSDTLKRWRIFRYDYDQEATYPLWNAYRCIVAEVDLEGKTYVLANGQWREVAEELKRKVGRYFEEHGMILDAPYLPERIDIYDADRSQYREDKYNESAVLGEDRLFLFDKAKVDVAGKRLYEIFDILHADKVLIHVKKYSSGAASISHIFVQSKFYSHAFSTDPTTRKSIVDWIERSDIPANRSKDKDAFKHIIPEGRPNESEYTVLFCILHNQETFGISDLPFMSQYELMMCHRFLTEDRHFKVGVVFRKVEF